MRMLVIEDDRKISAFVMNGLKQAGFAVDRAGDGEEGLSLALNDSYDAVVIDIMLPKMDGLALIEELRRNGVNTPLIILSAKRAVDDRVKGLETGGDDYLTKTFAFSELLARIHALIRRSSGSSGAAFLKVSDLVMDLISRRVVRSGAEIDLQPKEYALLEYLMRNHQRVLSKTLILEHIYDYNFDPQTNVVDVLICRLRNKIDRDFDKKMIHTIRGVGYVLKES